MAISPRDLNALYKKNLFKIAASEDYFKKFMAFVGKTNLTIPHEQFMCFIQRPNSKFCIKKEYIDANNYRGIHPRYKSKGIGYLNFEKDEPTKYYFDIEDIVIPEELGEVYKVFKVPKDAEFISYFVHDYKDNGIDDEKKLFDYLKRSFDNKKYAISDGKTREEEKFIEYYSIYAIFSKLELNLDRCEDLLKAEYGDIDFKNIIGEITEDRVSEVYPMYGIAKDIGKVVSEISNEIENYISVFPEEKRLNISKKSLEKMSSENIEKSDKSLGTKFSQEVQSVMEEYEVTREEAVSRLTTNKLEEALKGTNISINDFNDEQLSVFKFTNEDVKNYFSYPFLVTSLNARVDEKDYNSIILKEYFKDFEFADGRTLDNFNPFQEDEDVSDLINLTFFKNQDGEYRVIYSNSNSLMYHSELNTFIEKLDKDIEELKNSKIAIKVGTEFILLSENEFKEADIEIRSSRENVFVEGTKYPLYLGSTFDESTKVDKLIDSGKFTVYKINEHLKDNFDKNIALINDVAESLESIDVPKEKYNKNFIITNEVQAEKLTPSERLNNNLEAISMLKRLEKGERDLDISAQEVLAKYVGWGGLADVFDESKEGQWEGARRFLKDNLEPEEFEKAKESTLTSFYTPKAVIDSIYKTLYEMGFSKGNILEPSAGIGNFIGNLPTNMNESKVYAVELDSISGKIAKYLYPQSNIQIKGYEDTRFENNFFDVAIGNVPFGAFKVNDRKYNKNNFLIHDYFFAKTLDKVRSGGIVAFITSSGTMDKKDEKVRRYISSRAELIGAIRLPNTTFKGVAGTEVTSDILFLKKRDSIHEREESWIHLDKDENGFTYNKYFVDNPHMVLGRMEEVSGRFGNTLTCVPKEDESLEDLLNKASLEISINTKYEATDLLYTKENDNIPATEDIKNFSYALIDNNLYYREDSLLVKESLSSKNEEKVRNYLLLKEALQNVIEVQKNSADEEKLEKSRELLNDVYDDFYKKYGGLNLNTNKRLLNKDHFYPLISSIENVEKDGSLNKADIFFKRTIGQNIEVKSVDNAVDALILSTAKLGYIDLDYMRKLYPIDKEEMIEELKGKIFLDINSISENEFPFSGNKYEYVTADEYLSGNIRNKIQILDKYIEKISGLDELDTYKSKELSNLLYQKEKLNEVMPKPLTASEINVRLGATWIDPKYVNEFMKEKFGTPWYTGIEVEYVPLTSAWGIKYKSNDKNNDLVNNTYGTPRKSAYEILEDSLNLKNVRIEDIIEGEDGKKRYVLNKKETMLANQKQEIIKDEFSKWIWKDPVRREELEKIYNEKFNSSRTRVYNGENLLFEGMNPNIELREHQKNAVARTLFGGNTLLAHVVGAGKTFEMVASAMESKRLGLCSKSLIVVPNHLTEQLGREFMQLYPSANIMVATKNDFESKKRRKYVSKIATGDYDAVILGHSQFEKIPMSEEYQRRYINEQMQNILDYIEEYKNNKDEAFTVKQFLATKKKLEDKLNKLVDRFKKDDIITFEELGVDRIYIDEAHSYKNLYLYTKMQNVAGIGQTEAQKSSDMFMKCRYLDEITGGKGVIFATGTPVSNSMTELYTMQRYLQYDELEQRDLKNFDAWASTFGETVTALELSPEGDSYRLKTRFSKFYNLPELMTMFSDIADIKTADVLNLPTPNAHYETILTKPSEEQKEILKSISERADKVRNNQVDPSIDNMLKITNDGKKLALDQRLINPFLPDRENSKINIAIDNIFKIWEENKENKSTQLVFSDMSTPKNDEEFTIYEDIKDKLILKGIPEEEIEFIHNADNEKKKDTLFSKVRNGEVRILLGSTAKMGAGTNVQNKLIAIHDLDVPWRPADLEQRAGRIVRQGNENEDVYIYRYVTENTFDSYLWQTIENKQKFISQIMTSKSPMRVIEDMDEATLSYSEIKALATGNPLIKEKIELDNDIAKLKMLESNYYSNKYDLEKKILKQYPEEIKEIERNIECIKYDLEHIEKTEKFSSIKVDNIIYDDKKEGGEKLLETIKNNATLLMNSEKKLGEYRNLELSSIFNTISKNFSFILKGKFVYYGEFGTDSIGNITRLDNAISNIENILHNFERNLERVKSNLEISKIDYDKPFEKEEELKSKLLRLVEVNNILDQGNERVVDVQEDIIGELDTIEEEGELEELVDEVIDTPVKKSLESMENERKNYDVSERLDLLEDIQTAKYKASYSYDGEYREEEFKNIIDAYVWSKEVDEEDFKSYSDIKFYINDNEVERDRITADAKYIYEWRYNKKDLAIVNWTEASYLEEKEILSLEDMNLKLGAYNMAYKNVQHCNEKYGDIDEIQLLGYDKTSVSILSEMNGELEVIYDRYDIGSENDGLIDKLKFIVGDRTREKEILYKELLEIGFSEERANKRIEENTIIENIIDRYEENYLKKSIIEKNIADRKFKSFLNEFYDSNISRSTFYANDIIPINVNSRAFYIKAEGVEKSCDSFENTIINLCKEYLDKIKPTDSISINIESKDGDIELLKVNRQGSLKFIIDLNELRDVVSTRGDCKALIEEISKEYEAIDIIKNEGNESELYTLVYERDNEFKSDFEISEVDEGLEI